MTKKKLYSVRKFSKKLNVDMDDLFCTIWYLGIDNINNPNDLIPTRIQKQINQKYNVPSYKEVKQIKYWTDYYGISKKDLIKVCKQFGFSINERKSTLTKSEIVKIRSLTTPSSTKTIIIEQIYSRRKAPKQKPGKVSRLDWKVIGHKKELRHLKYDEVLDIHYALVRDYRKHKNPIDTPGVRSEHLLASAIFRQHTSLLEIDKYPTVEMCGAALLHSLVLNHPFHNGNKRTALVSLLVYLDVNGFVLTCNDDQLFKFVIKLAQHRLTINRWDLQDDREVQNITKWIRKYSRLFELGDHNLPFRRLRKILTEYKCECQITGRSSSKINIKRMYVKPSIIELKTGKLLKTRIKFDGEGEEIELETIKKIRQDLRLDEKNGVDSIAFYGKAPVIFDRFITKYRKILDRLASL